MGVRCSLLVDVRMHVDDCCALFDARCVLIACCPMCIVS